MWELTILEANLPARRLDSLAAADLDGDGAVELVTGGDGLYWLKPAGRTWGRISDRYAHVGVVVGDIDGDGKPEVIVGESKEPLPDRRATMPFGLGLVSGAKDWGIAWYRPPASLNGSWATGLIDPRFEGHVHDILLADIDNDGTQELIAISCYSDHPGIFILKRGSDPRAPWRKHAVFEGVFTEGLSLGDLDGDRQLEIVCGPDWYKAPAAGPLSGHWTRHTFAPGFREMCRTAIVQLGAAGRPDILIVESEYMDGRLSRFVNPGSGLARAWSEQRIMDDVVYGHSLDVRRPGAPGELRSGKPGELRFLVGEMQQGGWNAPYNHGARVLEFRTADGGATWAQELIGKGEGTHQALWADIDGDGELEVVGKNAGFYYGNPRVQVWKRTDAPSPVARLRHRMVDRDKPFTGVEILPCDVDGDGRVDIVCGTWWYRNPGQGRPGEWERREIPGVAQIINACDLDGDGRMELIGIQAPASSKGDFYADLSSNLCWLKARDPLAGAWDVHPIGKGKGDWPHGSLLGPFGRGGRLALAVSYHSAYSNPHHYPQLFEAPEDLKGDWPVRTLARIQYNEEMLACDIAGKGRSDIIAGPWWLENLGDGTFLPHRYAPDGIVVGRMGLMDIAGNGRQDIVIGQEVADWEKKIIPQSPLVWLERPADPRNTPWPLHTIDWVFCAHSIGVGDVDGDGQDEVVCGEHNPFWPYRSRCRLLVYKKADPAGRSWKRYTLEDRFEHHVGAKVFPWPEGGRAILSHGWRDSIYVHLWEPTG